MWTFRKNYISVLKSLTGKHNWSSSLTSGLDVDATKVYVELSHSLKNKQGIAKWVIPLQWALKSEVPQLGKLKWGIRECANYWHCHLQNITLTSTTDLDLKVTYYSVILYLRVYIYIMESPSVIFDTSNTFEQRLLHVPWIILGSLTKDIHSPL